MTKIKTSVFGKIKATKTCFDNLPWGIEFNQYVLGFVEGNRVKVLGDEHLDGVFVPVFRNILRKQVGFEFSINQVLDKALHSLGGHFVGRRFVLCHLFFQMDQAHGRKLTLLHAKEFEDALVIIFISINSDEENLIICN